MRPTIIRKSVSAQRPPPNLADYDAQRRDFSWDAIRAELCGASATGINLGVRGGRPAPREPGSRSRRVPLRQPHRPPAGHHVRRARAPHQPLRQRAADVGRRPRRPPVRAGRPGAGALCLDARRAQERHGRLPAVLRVRPGADQDAPRARRRQGARHDRGALPAQGRRDRRGSSRARARAPRRRERRAHQRARHARFRRPDGRGIGSAGAQRRPPPRTPPCSISRAARPGRRRARSTSTTRRSRTSRRAATRSICIPTTSSGARPIRAG